MYVTDDKTYRYVYRWYLSTILKTNYPEVFKSTELSLPPIQGLKTLCIQKADLKKKNKSYAHLLNFRQSVVLCFVSSFKLKDIKSRLERFRKDVKSKGKTTRHFLMLTLAQ